MATERQSPALVMVQCRCGRSLRAKFEQVGTEIRCWDCHQPVLVPIPLERKRAVQELNVGFKEVIRGPGLGWIVVGASILTACLAIPTFGLAAAVVAMTLGASCYGDIVRRSSETTPEPRNWKALLFPGSPIKILLCVLLAIGTLVPLWFLGLGEHRSPRWNLPGVLVASLTWVLIPLAMLMAYGRDIYGPLGFRKGLRLIGRHPLATILALATVPASLFLIELVLGVVFFSMDALTFFTLEYMPVPDSAHYRMTNGIPYYYGVDYRLFPVTRFLAAYFYGLGAGYTFVGAIPPSLSLPTGAGMSPQILDLPAWAYTAVRLIVVLVITSFLLMAFALQARWLGGIAAVEKRRPVSAPDGSAATVS